MQKTNPAMKDIMKMFIAKNKGEDNPFIQDREGLMLRYDSLRITQTDKNTITAEFCWRGQVLNTVTTMCRLSAGDTLTLGNLDLRTKFDFSFR